MPSDAPKARERGFILAATLWFCAILLLLAASFAHWTQGAVNDANTARLALRQRIDQTNTRNTLLYLFATQPMTFGGLTVTPRENRIPNADEELIGTPEGNELRLDAQTYLGIGDTRFSLQDERGLLTLNGNPYNLLDHLLESAGISPKKIPILLARLADFTDPDDFHRLGGAEIAQYEAVGRSPPPNRKLFSSWEVGNILGWEEHPSLFDQGWFPLLTTVSYTGLPNINTAPKLVLKTLRGLDEEVIDNLISQRNQTPITSTYKLNQIIGYGIPYPEERIQLFPGNRFRLNLWTKDDPQHATQWVIRMAPRNAGGPPWKISYWTRITRQSNPDIEQAELLGTDLFRHPSIQH